MPTPPEHQAATSPRPSEAPEQPLAAPEQPLEAVDRAASPGPTGRRPLAVRWLVGFGRFWWDFLVGDTPELFAGAVASLGLVAWVVHAHAPRVVEVGPLPALVLLLLWLTTFRARPR